MTIITAPSRCDGEVSSQQIEALDAHLLDLDTANRLAEIFKALSDPTRLRIIGLLMEHEVCVHTLEAALGMSQSAASAAIAALEASRPSRTNCAGCAS